MSIETIKSAIPDYAKDLKLNISSLAFDETLTPQQLWGTFLASAIASRNQFVIQQIQGTLKSYTEIESLISSHLKNWKIERLSKVDHTNLLLAVHDLCFSQTASHKVIINEAIEISKKFGTAESSSFINGILDAIAKAQ